MQEQESQEFPSSPMLEGTTTIPWNGENVEYNYVHNFANESSSVTGEEVGKEETNDEMKESKSIVPPTTFPIRLHKSKWSKNTPVGDKYFQDLITYIRIFETLELG
ncbi:hypothetical protein QYF36_025800 [Acer negundo]|nr:hypothetical protein QYF36_025800 [Acer negundo]